MFNAYLNYKGPLPVSNVLLNFQQKMKDREGSDDSDSDGGLDDEDPLLKGMNSSQQTVKNKKRKLKNKDKKSDSENSVQNPDPYNKQTLEHFGYTASPKPYLNSPKPIEEHNSSPDNLMPDTHENIPNKTAQGGDSVINKFNDSPLPDQGSDKPEQTRGRPVSRLVKPAHRHSPSPSKRPRMLPATGFSSKKDLKKNSNLGVSPNQITNPTIIQIKTSSESKPSEIDYFDYQNITS